MGARTGGRTAAGRDVNLLLFNLRTDASDTSLGFTTSWINLLAPHFARVFVVTMHAGRLTLAPNVSVHSIGGTTRFAKTATFYSLIWRLLRTERIDVCFSHMSPRLALLFSPLAKLYRIPILLWYAHGSVPFDLRLAHRVVEGCATSTPLGFRLRSRKLHILGQGIDVDRFVLPSTRPPRYGNTLLSVSRLTRSKRLDELIEAVRLLRVADLAEVRLVVAGGPVTAADADYEARVRTQVQRAGLGEIVEFRGPLPFDEVDELYHCASVFVNLSDTASLDKAILESMASGCIPVCRNRSFAAIAEQEGLIELVPGGGPAAVAESLRRALELPDREQEALRRRLRALVVRDHSLKRLIERVVGLLLELSRRGRA
jgi:glycosyltransferase involved in cell wall biosynthesis